MGHPVPDQKDLLVAGLCFPTSQVRYDTMLFLRETCRGASLGAVSGAVLVAAVCTHVLYTGLYSPVSSLGIDPFTWAVQEVNQAIISLVI